MSKFLLAIESSCDDTAISILRDGIPLCNVVSSQLVHSEFGGVVPEMASREHQKNIILVCDAALKKSGVLLSEINGVAVTIGPGLPGSLLVGASFAKGLSLGLGIPIVGVNHMEAHILSLFIAENSPAFPFLCLVVSGGHTQLVEVFDWKTMKVLGKTLDDAVGEAFDKCGKLLGLGYPAGKVIDDLASKGDPSTFRFPQGRVSEFDFSYSGVKTAVLYFIRDRGEDFVQQNLTNICASIQGALLRPLVEKTEKAMMEKGYTNLGLVGGVAANKVLRHSINSLCKKNNWKYFVPDFQYCTDNAAMIGQAGWFKFEQSDFVPLSFQTNPRLSMGEAF